MKKIPGNDKVIALIALAVAIVALVLSVICLVATTRTERYMNDVLLKQVGENKGHIVTIIDCIQGNKNACSPEALPRKY